MLSRRGLSEQLEQRVQLEHVREQLVRVQLEHVREQLVRVQLEQLEQLELSERELSERELTMAFKHRLILLLMFLPERILQVLLNCVPKQAVHDPNIDLTGGFVEFLLRVVMKHDDLDDQLNSLEEAYVIDALRFGSKHPWWGIIAARFHLYWWSLITFTKKGIEMSPAGKLVRSVAKKWGF